MTTIASLPAAAVLRQEWALAPGLRYLNHGGFGGVPRVVRGAADAVRAAVETNPTHFLARIFPDRVWEVRDAIAALLHADPAGLVFVPNATTGIATVLAGLRLAPGDEVVTTDHCYGAVRIALDAVAGTTGARVRVAQVALDSADDATVVAAIMAETNERTRAIVVDQVASASGFVFPVRAVVTAAHDRNLVVCVDAAHALAMLEVDLIELGADFWVGNLHKWLCAPRAAAVVAVAEPHRGTLRPLVPSHQFEQGLLPAFDWTGTHDPAPLLAAPTAVDYLAGLGWQQVRQRQTALATTGAAEVTAALGTRVPVADRFSAALRVAELPHPLSEPHARELERRLLTRHRIEVPVTAMHGSWRYVRVSGAVYNEPADYAALADVLPGELALLEG